MIYLLGADGQLGQSIQKVQATKQQIRYLTLNDLDITNQQSLEVFFDNLSSSDFIVNCAAYTSVDSAEDHPEIAFAVNAHATSHLARLCNASGSKLIHISTDYVFDGKTDVAYKECDPTNPLGVYGRSKRLGEQEIINAGGDFCIIRTAWLFSEFGNNFVKTMLTLIQREEISVVSDQIGSPTYAPDLGLVIFDIINNFSKCNQQIFHFSNSDRCSWYQFARKILGNEITINPVTTAEYPTKARRPPYSLLNTDKISTTLNIDIRNWQDALIDCLKELGHDNQESKR